MENEALRAARTRPALWLSAGVLATYASSLCSPFHFDDFAAIVRPRSAASLPAFLSSLGTGLRPALKLTYLACSALGLGTLGFHAVNVAIHLANACLVLALFNLAANPCQRPASRPVSAGAFLAAALFAFHPLQTEAVSYVSGRSSSLATLWYLLALLLHVRGLRTRLLFSAGLTPLVFLLALLTKESAAVFPLALLLWDLVIERRPVRGVLLEQALWWTGLTAVAFAAVLDSAYFSLLYDALGQSEMSEPRLRFACGVGYLVSRIALLGSLSIDPGLGLLPPAPGLVALGIVSLVLVVALAAAQVRRSPPTALGLGWFALHLVLPYALLSRVDVLNERHGYLATVGLFIALGATFDRLMSALGRSRALLLAALAAAVLATLLVQTARRNLDYLSERALWESTVKASPLNPRAHNNLGVAYEADGLLEDARRAYRRALELEPRFEKARINLQRLEASPAQ